MRDEKGVSENQRDPFSHSSLGTTKELLFHSGAEARVHLQVRPIIGSGGVFGICIWGV